MIIRKIYVAFFLMSGLLSCQKKQEEEKLPFFNKPDFTPEWISGNSPSIHTIAPFSFTNQNGETITEKAVTGKIHVADFFFTSCPGLCPKLTKNMQPIQTTFQNDPKVLLLSYSVMSDKDGVPELRKYADNHSVMNGKWHLLTGDRKQIYTLARQSYYADETLGQQKGVNDFLHTENFILVDTHRRIRGIYNGTLEVDIQQLIADIKVLEKEQ